MKKISRNKLLLELAKDNEVNLADLDIGARQLAKTMVSKKKAYVSGDIIIATSKFLKIFNCLNSFFKESKDEKVS